MEVGWQPENLLKSAKRLWSSSQVSTGQGRTLPHPSSKAGLPLFSGMTASQREAPVSDPEPLSLKPFWTKLPCCSSGADPGPGTRITANSF